MITYPKNWKTIGVEVTPQDVEDCLQSVLLHLDCSSLAFSGGLDSSLLLYYLCNIYEGYSCKTINAFTIGRSEDHMDVVFAKEVVERYREAFTQIDIEHHILCGVPLDTSGGEAVRLLYKFAAEKVDSIIAGDGIDEFMCGYYSHMSYPTEDNYFRWIRELQKEQFEPLNKNSGDNKVYLPYVDRKMVELLSQIPMKEKVDYNTRKKFMVEMAKDKVPDSAIDRRKYGFCDALKENKKNMFEVQDGSKKTNKKSL